MASESASNQSNSGHGKQQTSYAHMTIGSLVHSSKLSGSHGFTVSDKGGMNTWIVDSGATDHMTHSSHMFNTYTLSHVTFYPSYCMFQDQNSGKKIGLAKEKDGPYHLEAPSNPDGIKNNVSLSLLIENPSNKDRIWLHHLRSYLQGENSLEYKEELEDNFFQLDLSSSTSHPVSSNSGMTEPNTGLSPLTERGSSTDNPSIPLIDSSPVLPTPVSSNEPMATIDGGDGVLKEGSSSSKTSACSRF
ncbi:hypothetical protein LWI29_010791 [Acer saccharum]|uniref:Uncharacterized protein n=1 Tax=Acer saccharum TaxID=4024 RepID=A0AA39V0E2_ACESA|nr:hypothetical protein LWI29_010791 [Acer saccharum]